MPPARRSGPVGRTIPTGLPVEASLEAAQATNARDIRETTIRSGPRRVAGGGAEPVATGPPYDDAGPGADRPRDVPRPPAVRPGRRRPDDRGAHAQRPASSCSWSAASIALLVASGRRRRLRQPGAGPDPPVARRPARGAPTPARVRRRRLARAAHAADRHPGQRRRPGASPEAAGRDGRHRADRHPRRGRPPDRRWSTTCCCWPARIRARSRSSACRSTSATSPRRAPPR